MYIGRQRCLTRIARREKAHDVHFTLPGGVATLWLYDPFRFICNLPAVKLLTRLISLYLIVMSHFRSNPIMYKSNHSPTTLRAPTNLSAQLKPDTSSSSELIVADGGLVLGGAAHGVAGEDLRVVVDAGVEAEADGAADSLGHLALVHGAQTRLCRSLDPSVRRHELGDHGEVLLSR